MSDESVQEDSFRVSLTAEAVRRGLVAPGDASEAALGAVLLLVGALLTCAVILAGTTGPVQGYLAYGATVLWALTGIAVNQYAYSLVTTGASLVATVLVAFILFFPFAFLTTTFLPQEALTGWLATVADYNPVTYLLTGLRALITDGWVASELLSALGAVAAVGCVTFGLAFSALRARVRRA